jgi:hypothetical protein
MGRLNHRRRREHFDLTTMTRRIEALYEQLLAASPGGSRR